MDLLDSLFLSLRIAILATLLVTVVGVPLAFWIARRRPAGRTFIEALVTLPLVQPPTVVGYALVRLLGVNGWLGQWLLHTFDYRVLFREPAAVVAAAVVSLPLLFIPARAAFAGVERELEDVARLMGASPLAIFWHVSLPLARRGIASGLLLAFARALGEFGATVMVFGMPGGRMTLPISIFVDYGTGRATGAALLLTAASIAVIFIYNALPASRPD